LYSWTVKFLHTTFILLLRKQLVYAPIGNKNHYELLLVLSAICDLFYFFYLFTLQVIRASWATWQTI